MSGQETSETPEPGSPPPSPTPRQRNAGLIAAGLVGLEAVAVAGFAAYYLVELALGEATDALIVIMSVMTMAVFVIGLAYTAKGLLRRHPRAQAPAIAFNFLVVPLGIALFQFAPWWVAAPVLLAGAGTIASALLMGRLTAPEPPAD